MIRRKKVVLLRLPIKCEDCGKVIRTDKGETFIFSLDDKKIRCVSCRNKKKIKERGKVAG